uniref:hypothetical protein n=1 Tax=Corallococcus coralloides TaxID=184914 RepID=UPI00196B5786|nr:hypothetical protein [Corallococcus coralloides]
MLTESTYAPGVRLTLEGGFMDVVEGRARECPARSVAFQAPGLEHAQRIRDVRTRTSNIDFSEASWRSRSALAGRLDPRVDLTSARLGRVRDLLDAKLSALESDPYFQRRVREHDPAFGYTSARGLTELERCFRASPGHYPVKALGEAAAP